MRRLLVLAACGIILIGVVVAGAASAAQLSLQAPSEDTAAGAAVCTSATLSVAASGTNSSGTAGAVNLGAIPSSCAGLAAALTLYSSTGAALASATTSALSPGNNVIPAASSYTASAVAGAALTVDTRNVLTAWQAATPDDPATPGNSNTVISHQTWNSYGATNFCAVFTVTTNSTTPIAWVVNMNLGLRPFNGGQTDTGAYGFSNSAPVTPGAILNSLMPVEGDASYDNTVVAGTSHSFQVCDNNAPSPAIDPSRYTVGSPTVSGNQNYACVAVTITGIAPDTYYTGWTTTVDLAPMLALITAGGRTPGPVTWIPSNGVAVGTPTGTVYPITGAGYMVGIQSGQTLTIQGCSTGN